MGKLLGRVVAAFFLCLFLAFGAAIAYVAIYGLRSEPVPDISRYPLSLSEIRSLARSLPGALPRQVRALVVGRTVQSRGSVIAGQSWREDVPRVLTSFQIAFADRTLLVDPGYGEPVEPDALQALQEAMLDASHILLTHTHRDHVGALLRASNLRDLLLKLVMTREQWREPRYGASLFPAGSLEGLVPLAYDRVLAFAPGVVLIQAPGHTVGSQMIYVQLRDSGELLLVGDVVWNLENVRSAVGRPHLIGGLLLREDEQKVAHQIRRLSEILREEGELGLQLVPSHDAAQLERLIELGRIQRGFAEPRLAPPVE